MMNKFSDRIGLAKELVVLSKSMLEMAQMEQWDGLKGLEKQREHIIAALFADAEPGELDDDQLISMLREAHSCGDAVLALVVQERDRLGRELRDLRNARKAESVYAKVLDEVE